MCGKGSQTTTSTSAPNPQAMAAYTDLLGRAAGVASTPFTPYGGEFVAPLNAQQNQAGANINANAGFAQPFIGQARQYATQAAAPITGSNINQYLSPYTQDVVNATQAQFNNQNKQQLENVRGNAIAQGALGGDREAVAEANLSNQQNLSEAPVIAGLYNQGYNTALSTALQEQQNLGQSAYSLGNLGVAGQNAALSGANAQLAFGTLGQSAQQALDQALYNQFLAQQGFPFQEAQWQAGIDTAVGSQMGGTSSTTGPPPNQTGQFLGLGLAGLSLLNRGGGVGRSHGGKIPGFAIGGMPYDGGSSYIPSINLTQGQGAPKAPGLPGQQQPDPFKLASSTMDLEKKIKGLGGSGSGDGGILYGGEALGLNQDYSEPDGILLGPEALGLDSFARGGKIRGFAGGGLADDAGLDDIPSFDDRFSGVIYDPRADRAERAAAMDSLRPGEQPGPGLGLGDIVSSYSPGFQNNFGYDFGGPGVSAPSDPNAIRDGLLLDRAAAFNANRDSAYPLSGIDPADSATNNFGYDFNPLRTDANRAYGPAPSDYNLPAFATTPATPLPEPVDIADNRPHGLDAAAMSYAPEGNSNPISGYAPVPGSQGAPAIPTGDQGEKHGGFGFLDKLGIHMDPNLRKALLTAGFAMMASRSPFLGNAIGEGGLAGINAYTGAQKADLEAEKTKASIEDARKKLEMHADEFQKKLALDTKRLQSQQEQQQFLRDKAEKLLEQGKYTMSPGMGTDAQGNQVAGAYRFNTKTGEAQFMPGVTPAPKGSAVGVEPTLSPETRQFMARAYLQGDYRQMQNLGRGAQGAANIVALREDIRKEAERQGLSPEQAATKAAEFQGLAAGERALGTRTAQIEMAANEARNMVPTVRAAMAELPRTSLMPINKLIEGWQTGVISDPKQAAAAAAVNSYLNAYVRAVSPTGVPTDTVRQHAYSILTTAMQQGTVDRVLGVMDQEMQAAQRSPEQVKDKFRQMYGGAPGGAAAPGTSGAPTRALTAQDQAALQWANANPGDPRAAQIKQRLGVQ